jgi:large subunit ribosomal protein L18
VAISRKDRIRTKRRTQRVRGAQHRGVVPRVTVFRSLKGFYGQIIDDNAHKTLVSSSSSQVASVTGDKKSVAQAIGKDLAQRAKAQGIDRVIFDRGSYRYHGRVKAFADGLREGGLQL